jgi:hypothetical protein
MATELRSDNRRVAFSGRDQLDQVRDVPPLTASAIKAQGVAVPQKLRKCGHTDHALSVAGGRSTPKPRRQSGHQEKPSPANQRNLRPLLKYSPTSRTR